MERVRKQNRELVNKVKDLQLQLQGLVDKLRKEKKKVNYYRNHLIEHYGVYTRPLTVKLIIVEEENLECLDILRPKWDLLRKM